MMPERRIEAWLLLILQALLLASRVPGVTWYRPAELMKKHEEALEALNKHQDRKA